MRYLSTRGDATTRRFSEILLEGLAPDGGLYLPSFYPQVDASTLSKWRSLTYPELAFEVLSLYIDDIPADELRTLVNQTYTAEVFGDGRITPLKKLGDGLWLQALSNGPTLAFKDVAMQLLGHLFEYELARRHDVLNVLGATSGDTGSAAEYALRGKAGIAVFMLSPHGRMSPFQQAQMFSLQDANIHNLTVDGVFDDCQDMVKSVSNDLAFKRAHRIGTVNSINWARLLAQVVYYFAGYLAATSRNDERVSFAVPSGNFGNICAGHIARSMGLPIARLVLATNENNVLEEFFRTGTYRVRSAAETHETSSPSMDISKASNFERFVFDLVERDSVRAAQLFANGVDKVGHFTLSGAERQRLARFGFVAGTSAHADRLATIRRTHDETGLLVDTHTADGLHVALQHRQPGIPMIVLETAQPVKFAETVFEAVGFQPPVPANLQALETLPRRFERLGRDVDALKQLIDTQGLRRVMTEAVPARPPLLSLDDAIARVLAAVGERPIRDIESVSTFEARGRVLAADVVSDIDVPPLDNAEMDGYALREVDVPSEGTWLRVAQRIAAGGMGHELRAGEAARIFTGAPVPAGADAVVMQEVCTADGDHVRIDVRPRAGQFIRRRGADVRRGSRVLATGTRLTPQALGLAASVGAGSLSVMRRPKVAMFSTGDELAMPGEALKPGGIYNSNRFTLRALIEAAGGVCDDLGIVPDDLAATRASLRRAATSNDVIVTCGGVSVGEEDHLKPAVRAEGRLELWQIAVKPGKPFAFGDVLRPDGTKAFFTGLPGNPVSSFITCQLVVRPLLLRLQGASDVTPRPILHRADFDWPKADKRREFLRVRRNDRGGLDLFTNQSSGVLTSTVWADGVVDNPAGQAIDAGDAVAYIPFAEWQS